MFDLKLCFLRLAGLASRRVASHRIVSLRLDRIRSYESLTLSFMKSMNPKHDLSWYITKDQRVIKQQYSIKALISLNAHITSMAVKRSRQIFRQLLEESDRWVRVLTKIKMQSGCVVQVKEQIDDYEDDRAEDES